MPYLLKDNIIKELKLDSSKINNSNNNSLIVEILRVYTNTNDFTNFIKSNFGSYTNLSDSGIDNIWSLFNTNRTPPTPPTSPPLEYVLVNGLYIHKDLLQIIIAKLLNNKDFINDLGLNGTGTSGNFKFFTKRPVKALYDQSLKCADLGLNTNCDPAIVRCILSVHNTNPTCMPDIINAINPGVTITVTTDEQRVGLFSFLYALGWYARHDGTNYKLVSYDVWKKQIENINSKKNIPDLNGYNDTKLQKWLGNIVNALNSNQPFLDNAIQATKKIAPDDLQSVMKSLRDMYNISGPLGGPLGLPIPGLPIPFGLLPPVISGPPGIVVGGPPGIVVGGPPGIIGPVGVPVAPGPSPFNSNPFNPGLPLLGFPLFGGKKYKENTFADYFYKQYNGIDYLFKKGGKQMTSDTKNKYLKLIESINELETKLLNI